jgi:hypothetical protein
LFAGTARSERGIGIVGGQQPGQHHRPLQTAARVCEVTTSSTTPMRCRVPHAGHHCAERAASLPQAGEYYAILGEHDLAEQMFRDAVDIEDAEPGSAQAAYASFLLNRHRHDEALVTEARRLNRQGPDVFSVIGEALAEHGHPQQAAGSPPAWSPISGSSPISPSTTCATTSTHACWPAAATRPAKPSASHTTTSTPW